MAEREVSYSIVNDSEHNHKLKKHPGVSQLKIKQVIRYKKIYHSLSQKKYHIKFRLQCQSLKQRRDL